MGDGRDEDTVALYGRLFEQAQEVESKFGGELDWTAPEGRRSATVSFKIEDGGWRDKDRWPAIYQATIDAMIKFWAAVEPALVRATS